MTLYEVPNRPMRNGKGPRAHEWSLFSAGLWRCPWCDGFVESQTKPDPEAKAISSERMASLGLLTELVAWAHGKEER